MNKLASTPKPPYYAVIFTSLRTDQDNAGYGKMAEKMLKLASQQPGFLGVESVREHLGITLSYWSDLGAIQQWKTNIDHQIAQHLGLEKWYSAFRVRIAKVERDYGMNQ